jgi:hypothetical protein
MQLNYGEKYKDNDGNVWLLHKHRKGYTLGTNIPYTLYGVVNQDGRGAVITEELIKMLGFKKQN